jgi:ring-1,2-phenylacetyl-CoA epoxidase subunit PaaD
LIAKENILRILENVKDPEIPALSIVDLGIVREVELTEDGYVNITLTPTFVGCPALKIIEDSVYQILAKNYVRNVTVKTTYDSPWNSNMISQRGRERLRKSGIAPPSGFNGSLGYADLLQIECPFCGSRETEFRSLFGSALCRSIHYCNNCLQSFEQFKPVE